MSSESLIARLETLLIIDVEGKCRGLYDAVLIVKQWQDDCRDEILDNQQPDECSAAFEALYVPCIGIPEDVATNKSNAKYNFSNGWAMAMASVRKREVIKQKKEVQHEWGSRKDCPKCNEIEGDIP